MGEEPTKNAAHVAAAQLVSEYVAEAEDLERVERERLTQGATFREVAHTYLRWLDRPTSKITTREIEDVLTTISETGVSPRTVNKHRT